MLQAENHSGGNGALGNLPVHLQQLLRRRFVFIEKKKDVLICSVQRSCTEWSLTSSESPLSALPAPRPSAPLASCVLWGADALLIQAVCFHRYAGLCRGSCSLLTGFDGQQQEPMALVAFSIACESRKKDEKSCSSAQLCIERGR